MKAQARRTSEPEIPKTNAGLLVGSVVALAIAACVSIVLLAIFRPGDSTPIIASILGVLVPLMTALLAAAIQSLHTQINGRLTELLSLTAEANHAAGVLKGKEGAREHE